MDVGQAMKLLKAGKIMRRRGWVPGRYIWWTREIFDAVADDLPGMRYSPTQDDLLSDDWEEFE